MIRCTLWTLMLVLLLFAASCLLAQTPPDPFASSPDGKPGMAPGGPGATPGGMGGGIPGDYAGMRPQGQGSISWKVVQDQLQMLGAQVELVKRKLDIASERLHRIQEQAKMGVVQQSEVGPREIEVAELQTQLASVTRVFTRVSTLGVLAKPIDVELKNASIKQAAEAISRVAGEGITIGVAAGVPDDLRVNTQARGVPLGTVLEMIASTAGLVIAPGTDNSFTLGLPRTMEIDGQKFRFEETLGPWSDEWGVTGSPPPLRSRSLWMMLVNAVLPPDGPPVADAPGVTPYFPPMTGGSVAIAAVGPDRIVLCEPAPGPDGATGCWLTLYQINPDGPMQEISRTFHRSSQPEPQPEPGRPAGVMPPPTPGGRK